MQSTVYLRKLSYLDDLAVVITLSHHWHAQVFEPLRCI